MITKIEPALLKEQYRGMYGCIKCNSIEEFSVSNLSWCTARQLRTPSTAALIRAKDAEGAKPSQSASSHSKQSTLSHHRHLSPGTDLEHQRKRNVLLCSGLREKLPELRKSLSSYEATTCANTTVSKPKRCWNNRINVIRWICIMGRYFRAETLMVQLS